MAESIILSEFVRKGVPVLIPFGDNDKYYLVVQLKDIFKSVQIKYGRYAKGVVVADIRHRIGTNRIKYETYSGKVDYIAIWCAELNTSYLMPIEECGKTHIFLRVDEPKNNSCTSTIIWASDYDFSKVLLKILNE